jgi:tRNA (uracil-5-)-methyltransferase
MHMHMHMRHHLDHDPDHDLDPHVGPPPRPAAYLPGYHAQLHEDAVQHSIDKLRESKDDLQLTSWPAGARLENINNIQTHPCLALEETLAYRCNCSFQIVRNDRGGRLEYAMREGGRVKPLGSSRFPIANMGIQNTMHHVLDELNARTVLQEHLTSASFASTWNERDVAVTLHYDHPVDEQAWLSQASLVRDKLAIFKLSSRSKGRLLALPPGPAYLKDTIWLHPDTQTVSRFPPLTLTATTTTATATTTDNNNNAANAANAIPVHYEKPETAFFHPNPRAMTKALAWILSRLTPESRYLLEMYCGCGAHTMALAKSGLLAGILAIELDQRLVDACIRNAVLNHCHEQGPTPVRVLQGDAGTWAKRNVAKPNSQQQQRQDYDVLLVDPPRQGLDPQVCYMAMHGTFQQVLYISCGREALKRDLDTLLQVFDIVDCQLFDLFPRTDSIESVVHLRRKCPAKSGE